MPVEYFSIDDLYPIENAEDIDNLLEESKEVILNEYPKKEVTKKTT